MCTFLKLCLIPPVLLALTQCAPNAENLSSEPSTPAPDVSQSLKPIASVQDIMTAMIDPAADFLWASVSTVVSADGIEEIRPTTDADWAEVRRQAVILTEGANLIQVPGRKVVAEGVELEDVGTTGNLTAAESEAAMTAKWDSFQVFARSLRNAGTDMLQAVDIRSTDDMLTAGNLVDQACESCHLQFWYPGQYIPPILEKDLHP